MVNLWQKLRQEYPLHCTVYTKHCIVYTAKCTLHTEQCTLHTEYCTLFPADYLLHNPVWDECLDIQIYWNIFGPIYCIYLYINLWLLDTILPEPRGAGNIVLIFKASALEKICFEQNKKNIFLLFAT